MKYILKFLCFALLLFSTGCVAMREKGDINLPHYVSIRPSVCLTASYTSKKNGVRRAYMNEYCRKDTLKKASAMLEKTGLFGPIYTQKNHSADLAVHCDLTMDTLHEMSDFWACVFTLQLYPDRTSLDCTLRTRVIDNRTGKKYNATANDLITIYNSIWLLPVAPFMPATSRAKALEKYLFESTIQQIATQGLFRPKGRGQEMMSAEGIQ